MPRNSGQSGNRSFGLVPKNGKGDRSRTTDVKAYNTNFEEIDWKNTSRQNVKTLREIEDEFSWRHGL